MKYIITALLGISLLACNKFEDKLEVKNNESGVVLVRLKGGQSNTAKIGEEIEVYTKIGMKDAALQFYIGNVPMTPLSRESRMVLTPNYGAGDSILLPMEIFTFKVPDGSPLGPNNLYFTADGERRPPVTLIVSKPDILYPGKIIVEPFIKATRNDFTKVDGPIGTAVMGNLLDIAYDENNGIFYFLESFYNADYTEQSYVVRKLLGGVLTTLAGGGADFNATEGKQRNLGRVLCMRAGPDGQLYLATETSYMKYAAYLGYELRVYRPEIIKADPQTGRLQHVAGGKMVNGSEFSYEGLRDGKESALLKEPSSMAFDKTGNLFFIDGQGTVVRKLVTDGTVSTLYGGVDSVTYEGTDWGTGAPVMQTDYSPVFEHSDGFGNETRFNSIKKIVMAGNGKLYVLERAGQEFRENIREINPDTKEVSTVIGQPAGGGTFTYSGTFKEVDLNGVLSFDVDFDGNILFTNRVMENWIDVYKVYRMDLQQENVTFLAGSIATGEESYTQPQPGEKAAFGAPERIVFDKFGSLYAIDGAYDIQVKKITIER